MIDAERYSAYGAKAGPTFEKYEGRVLVRNTDVAYREDEATDLNVVVEFPSLQKAMEWKESIEYTSIEGERKSSMKGMFIIVEGVE